MNKPIYILPAMVINFPHFPSHSLINYSWAVQSLEKDDIFCLY